MFGCCATPHVCQFVARDWMGAVCGLKLGVKEANGVLEIVREPYEQKVLPEATAGLGADFFGNPTVIRTAEVVAT